MLAFLDSSDLSTMGTILCLSVALVGLIAGVFARRHDHSISLTIWFSIAFGSLALLTTGLLQPLCAITGATCALFYRRWKKNFPIVSFETGLRSRQAFAIIGVLSITWILLYRMSADFLPPLVWEATVILNYDKELKSLDITKAFLDRLIWAEGLLSEGDRSLLFGFPTLCLLTLKSSLVSIRIFSVVSFLGATLCLAALCRCFVIPAIGAIVIFTFGLNELGLIFGRYGSSIASTLFALTLALSACASLVARPTVRRALLALVSLYLATLGYAPGRIVVLVLIGMTLAELVRQASMRASLVFCAGVAIVCAVQHHMGHLHDYAFGRGEQLSTMMRTGYLPDPLLSEWASFKAAEREPGALDYFAFGKSLLTSVTIPELRELISPFDQPKTYTREFSFDPLRLELYAKPLYPFILVGLLMASNYTSRWLNTTLFMWTMLGCAPILLTNRVDSFRTSMLLIPISIWLAIGIKEALVEARRVRVPHILIAGVLLGTILTITTSRSASLHFQSVTPSVTDLVIESIPPRLLHNATLGVEAMGFRSLALTKLTLLERQQRGMTVPGTIMSRESYASLTNATPSEAKATALDELTHELTNGAPLILGPPMAMSPTLDELSRRGFQTQSIRVDDLDLAYVVKVGPEKAGSSDR